MLHVSKQIANGRHSLAARTDLPTRDESTGTKRRSEGAHHPLDGFHGSSKPGSSTFRRGGGRRPVRVSGREHGSAAPHGDD